MATAGVPLWSTTAANNATADPAVAWPEGQAPSTVNDSARAMMASVAGWRNDLYGITTGGSSTAYTIATASTFATAAAMSGAIFTIIPHTTSGAAPTLAVDGLTARNINQSTTVNVATGALIAGTPYMVKYVHASTEFILIGRTNVFTTLSATGNVTVGGTLGVTGITTFTGVALAPDGSKTAPGYAFSGDTDTGIYRIGSNNLGISCGDTKIVDVTTSGATITGGATATGALTGATAAGAMIATQAEQETGSATDKLVSPGRQHFHPSAAKAWGKFDGADATIDASYNITSIVRDSAGDYTVTLATDFSSADYAIVLGVQDSGGVSITRVQTQAAGSFTIKNVGSAFSDRDPDSIYFACYGDHA